MKEKVIDIRTTHVFNVLLAKEIGVEKAILLNNIEFWVKYNTANGSNFHDGYHWTFNSAEAYQKQFPYMSASSIARYFRELESDGYIISNSKLNKNPYDRTKWYSLTNKYYDFFKLQFCICQNDKSVLQNENSIFQSTYSYTDTVPNTGTDINKEKELMSPNGDTPLFPEVEDKAGMQINIHAQEKSEGAGSVNVDIETNQQENSLFNNNIDTNKMIASTARKSFDNLSGVMQKRVLEVLLVFREVTGKKDSLTKDRLSCIVARLKEDVSIKGEDVKIDISHFKRVFEYMTQKWCNDTKMAQYIQLETFCGQKMHRYLEEATAFFEAKQNAPQKDVSQTTKKKNKTVLVV